MCTIRNVKWLCAHPFDVPRVTQAKFPEPSMAIGVKTDGRYILTTLYFFHMVLELMLLDDTLRCW